MEFCEKLRELRKRRGLTQEELAEMLHVSRAAVAKWESGRGYPGIDSLKNLAVCFGVSVDDLLSGEALLTIAEQENKANLRRLCRMLLGMADLLSLAFILLPLYPKTMEGQICCVNLLRYTETAPLNRVVYWTLFFVLILLGILQLAAWKTDKFARALTVFSMTLGGTVVLCLGLAGEVYAVVTAFLLFLLKGALLFYSIQQQGQ